MLMTYAIPALDCGLGIAIGNDAYIRTISVPIKTEHMLVEPFGEYYRYESENQYWKENTTNYGVGCGVFYKKPMRPTLDLLIGGRVAIYQQTANYDPKSSSSVENTSTSLGYTISPSLGSDWSVNEFVSVGIECGIRFNRYVSTIDYDNSSARDDQKGNSTQFDSKVWLRVYF